MSSQNMDKLIPEVFAEMRSNLNQSTQRHARSQGPTTQSLMHELDSLDRILATVKKLNGTISGAITTDLHSVHSVCVSSNKLLDAWIGVQSQAGYVHRLMSEPAYVSHLKESGGESKFEEEVLLESSSVERLKQVIAEEKGKARASAAASATAASTHTSRIAKPRTTSQRPVRTRKLFRR